MDGENRSSGLEQSDSREPGIGHHRPVCGYFRRPIPRTDGFSPYAWPAPLVHGLLFLLLGAAAWFLVAWQPLGWISLLLCMGCGLYLTRDLAMAAHYLPGAALVLCLAGIPMLAVAIPALAQWRGRLLDEKQLAPGLLLTLLLVILVVWRAWRHACIVKSQL